MRDYKFFRSFFIGNFFSKEIHIILERLMHLDNKFDADLAFDFDHIIECAFVFGLFFLFFYFQKNSNQTN